MSHASTYPRDSWTPNRHRRCDHPDATSTTAHGTHRIASKGNHVGNAITLQGDYSEPQSELTSETCALSRFNVMPRAYRRQLQATDQAHVEHITRTAEDPTIRAGTRRRTPRHPRHWTKLPRPHPRHRPRRTTHQTQPMTAKSAAAYEANSS